MDKPVEANWPQFYHDRGETYVDYCRKQYQTHIDEIKRQMHAYSAKELLVLELGVGTGTITAILMEDMHRLPLVQFIGVDKDEQMLKLAIKRLKDLPGDLVLGHGDIRELGVNVIPPAYQPIIHSHGVLEHFSDEEIVKIVSQFDPSVPQVHYVPGIGHCTPSYGDERLLPVQHWVDLLGPTRITTFNEGKDYCIVLNG